MNEGGKWPDARMRSTVKLYCIRIKYDFVICIVVTLRRRQPADRKNLLSSSYLPIYIMYNIQSNTKLLFLATVEGHGYLLPSSIIPLNTPLTGIFELCIGILLPSLKPAFIPII